MLRSTLAALLLASSALAFAQAQKAPAPAYEPSVGQEGKDVVWVPTPQVLVDKMLDMAKVTPADFVMDLGSGDGRTVITAAKRGARALGIEYNPDMVELSKRNAEKDGVSRRAPLRQGRPVRDRLLEGDRDHHVPAARHQPEAAPEDPRPEARHAHRVQHLHHGRVAGRRDRRARRERRLQNSWCTALLWIVPAQSRRHLQARRRATLTLKQKFQMLSGTLRTERQDPRAAGQGARRGDLASRPAARTTAAGSTASSSS